MAAPVVGLVGMAALRRDIKHLTDNDQSALYAAIKDAGRQAAEPVAARTRATVPHSGGDHAGRLAGDVRTSGTKTGAAVRMGRKSVPYAGWVEFGGTRPDGSSREYVATGRYLFPAAQGLGPVSADRYAAAMSRLFETSGVWTNSTDDGSAIHD
jgi:hypothetical protein